MKKRSDLQTGPGNSFYYVLDDGEIMHCRWNDEAWCTRTFMKLSNMSNYNLEMLLREAYEEGMRDQLLIIQRTLGIKS